MNKKIHITGGAGLVGSHLCERLAEEPNNQIFSLDNYFTGSQANHLSNVTYITGDTEDKYKLIDFTPVIVYHLGEYSRVE